MSENTPTPHVAGQPKVQASGLAGALATILLAIASAFDIQLSQEAAAGFVLSVMTIVGYFKTG